MSRSIYLLAVALSAPALAQSSAPPIQGLDNFTLAPSRQQPAPVVAPSPTPTPRATPVTPPAVVPTVSRTPVPRASASPAATPTRAATVPVATPSTVPTPTPTPLATATPQPSPAAVTQAASSSGSGSRWPWLVGGVLLVALASAAWLYRRRRPSAGATVAADPVPVPVPVAPSPPPAAVKGLVTSKLTPEIVIDLTPVRAGTDTLRAVVDYEVDIRNEGRAAAQQVWVEVALFSAMSGPDAELESFLHAQPTAPVAPPFALPSGGAGRIAGTVSIDRDRLHVLEAGGRRMFVPIVAVRVLYAHSSVSMEVQGATFLIGIERPGEARMAPLRLDGSGLREDVGVRRHTPVG